MKLDCPSFANMARIPECHAFCVHCEEHHARLGENRSPHLRWSDLPEGTRSLALLCHDPDVPAVGDDVNREGCTVSAGLPRVDFFHWVLVDIPPETTELPEGADSDGITPHGKRHGKTPYGVRGINSYTGWFAGDSAMRGDYGGYDGPCPPWNDERLHHYHFTLFALDVPSLGLLGTFDGEEARRAMRGHILAQAEWVGTYSLYPPLL